MNEDHSVTMRMWPKHLVLLETNDGGLFAEATTAEVEAVLANESLAGSAHTAAHKEKVRNMRERTLQVRGSGNNFATWVAQAEGAVQLTRSGSPCRRSGSSS